MKMVQFKKCDTLDTGFLPVLEYFLLRGIVIVIVYSNDQCVGFSGCRLQPTKYASSHPV